MKPKGVGIISIPDAERTCPVLSELIEWFSERSIEIYLEEEIARIFDTCSNARFSRCPLERLPDFTDLIIVMGGDGTLLMAARRLCESNVPMLGVNLGSLGFLTEVKREELITTLEVIFKDKYFIDERMMLCTTVYRADDKVEKFPYALNDVVINKEPKCQIILLSTTIDGKQLNTFFSDGLIISTPTGSTAYSLSAGGPIIHPSLHAILLTPICPHILTNRPIVLTDQDVIKIQFKKNGKKQDKECLLSIDGQVLANLKPNDTVEVSKAPHTLKLIQSELKDYYQVLRTKLKWGERG